MENLNNVPFIPQMPIFGKVGDLASTAAMTPKEFEAYQDSVDAYRTTMASYEFHEKKGREEGRAEGIAEGITDVARSLKSAGMDYSFISTHTGLSIEEIEKL